MAIARVLSALQGRVIQSPLQALGIAALILPFLYVILNEFVRSSARVKGMRGPTGLPLIGNLAQIRSNAAEQYRIWSRKFGSVYQIQLGNIPVVVVNSATAAKVLFGQNAQALSSRPEFYTFHKIVSNTAGTTIGTSPYSDSLKRRRKGAASALNRPSVETYVPHLDVESKAFVEELNRYGNGGKTPVDPMPMIQRLSLSLALTLNWGVRVASQEEDMFDEITHVEEEISKFRSTTGNLQDYIPLLRLNPFSSNSKKAAEMRKRRDKYLGSLNRNLDQLDDAFWRPRHRHHSCRMEYRPTLDPTRCAGQGHQGNPGDVRHERAHVLGGRRPEMRICCSPGLTLFRYFTVLRLALPRTSIKDITYQGTVIPKGTVFFPLIDPDVWTDPDVFRPERWFEQPDAPLFTYGMGYRMCAGSLLANRELYLVFMRTLNSFHIKPHDDVDWHPVHGNSDPSSLVAIPQKYKVRFVPKDAGALNKILTTS